MKEQDSNKKISIEEIEEMAVRGEDVTPFFGYKNAKLMPPVDKVERVQKSKDVPTQSLIKTMLREAIDRYFSNKK